jgi:hypothetical protein
LFVNSNASVLLKLIHKLTFNNMVLNFSMPLHFFNKLVLLVSSKIFHLHLVVVLVLPSVSVHQLMAKKLVVSAHHLASKAAASVLVLVLVMVLVLLVVALVVDLNLHHLHSNQAHTEVVLVLVVLAMVVLVVSMLLLLLSVVLILTKMGVSIIKNSTVSTNKAYK